MQLSKNLSLSEMIRSESAKRLGINNMPTQEHLDNMKKLAINIFQPIREHFNIPIHISSGYRSLALNKAIKGASTSQHCKGEAMDIDMDATNITNKQIFNYIKDNLVFDQLIWEGSGKDNPDWVHVSYSTSGKQRKQILKTNDKKTYTNY
ncbi:D-Ala-D-Ala carboxypeptidase family metallohydrolase [Flavobacterium sp.]|uniref:D-Ala-D-Ala carboxypeptidase family metallohydrolase n=1 Tax=Flavobacterium sp. TaxID=239 RepID=UPI0025D52A8E|nr:D-Ala-D-Ala carboxypeptidase family metallohydrolase [Flavobacterium sp.]